MPLTCTFEGQHEREKGRIMRDLDLSSAICSSLSYCFPAMKLQISDTNLVRTLSHAREADILRAASFLKLVREISRCDVGFEKKHTPSRCASDAKRVLLAQSIYTAYFSVAAF